MCRQWDAWRPLRLRAPRCLWILTLESLWAIRARAKSYAESYSFLADRSECDGQCAYCNYAHNHHRWSDIRGKLSRYVYRRGDENTQENKIAAVISALEHKDLQVMIDWSWTTGAKFECIIGIIAMRMLSYGFSDPFQFNDGVDFGVLDFLDVLNHHTGALDLLTSSWASLLAGGWPVFKELLLISRKLRDRLKDDSDMYPKLHERGNLCDIDDSDEDVAYRERVRSSLEDGNPLRFPAHVVQLRRGLGCPVGTGVALLSMALDLVRNHDVYQGSMKDTSNLVLALISAGQDAIAIWISSKSNWSPYFDLLTTNWPLWEVLSELACVDTNRHCVTRSALQCYDMVKREEVPCPHEPPKMHRTFEACGEHHFCSWPPELVAEEWCVPFDARPTYPLEPWLLTMGHDQEERICSQCGQDGVLRAIFQHIGFRDAAGPAAEGARPPYYVEFGARKPGMLNSAVLRQFCGWEGLLMDGQPGETPHGACPTCPGGELVQTEFLTAENIVEIFRKYDVPPDFDLMTIDIDFNDYWIWSALLKDGTYRPRVVAMDFNPDHPLDSAKVVKYEPFAEWDGSKYTVASLLAYALLARAHGYSFAYALEMGAHAFFVRSDLLAEADRALPLRSTRKMSHPPDALRRQFVDVLYDFVPAQAGGNRSESSDEVIALRHRVEELQREVERLRSSSRGAREPAASAAGGGVDQGSKANTDESAATLFYEDVLRRQQL